ncbi:MAG: sensor histidine kinase [Lachnospiraceae bacterium]
MFKRKECGVRKEYEILNKMLDDAINGEFEETCFDETELSKLQSKLMRYLTSSSMSEKKINEEKDNLKELITNISHQTKMPLTNILIYSELLGEIALDSRAREYVEEIHIQSKKLEGLIDALVKMSRLETGIFQFQKENVVLQEVVSKVVDQAYPKAKIKNIVIEIEDGDGVKLYLDKKWVVEAIYNILDNAIKYSGEGTKIIINTFSYEMFSGVKIADQGMGMSEDEIPKIFHRFYRGRAVHDKEGIGVGLFLSRQIIEGHGGYIKVNSVVGKGSTFDICFPNI